MEVSRPFRSGEAFERITLQSKTVTKNAIGEEVVTWADVLPVTWAEAHPISGKEFFSAEQTRYQADVLFRIRYRTGLSREHRVVWRGENYDITQIIDVGARRHTHEILAVNGLRNGL